MNRKSPFPLERDSQAADSSPSLHAVPGFRRQFARLLATLLWIEGTLITGCAEQAVSVRGPIHYFIYVDQTRSVRKRQRQLWLDPADQLAGHLQPGDQVTIYGVHDRSSDTAPLFNPDPIPIADPEDGIDGVIKARAALVKVRKNTRSVLEQAIAEPELATATDVLGGMDRCKRDPARRNILVFFSDMLQSSGPHPLDMEKHIITRDQIPRLVNLAIQSQGWNQGTLSGALVYVVLPSAHLGESRPLNSPQIVGRFYEALVAALGGRLVLFDTFLPAGEQPWSSGG